MNQERPKVQFYAEAKSLQLLPPKPTVLNGVKISDGHSITIDFEPTGVAILYPDVEGLEVYPGHQEKIDLARALLKSDIREVRMRLEEVKFREILATAPAPPIQHWDTMSPEAAVQVATLANLDYSVCLDYELKWHPGGPRPATVAGLEVLIGDFAKAALDEAQDDDLKALDSSL